MSRRIVVHSLDHARAAVEAAAALSVPVTLQSAPGAGAYAGARWFKALVDAAAAAAPGAEIEAVIDCGAEPGTVLAALRAGFARVIFTGPAAARTRLGAIAASQGGAIERGDAPCLDLLDAGDVAAACRAFLAPPEAGD